MDPADNGRAPAGQRSQTALLEHGLAAVFQAVHELSQHMAQLAVNSAQAGAVAPPAPPPEPPIGDPEPFAGDLNQCRGFLFQCRTVLARRPRALPTERSRVDYVIGRLRGRTLSWAQALHANGTLETLLEGEVMLVAGQAITKQREYIRRFRNNGQLSGRSSSFPSHTLW